MEQIKFQDIKNRLLTTIQAKMPVTWVQEEGGFTLVEGFFTQPMQTELSGNLIIGGPSVPTVAIVGKNTGRMYFFALKALLPDLKI
jgi:hypothetical protein